MSFPLQQGVAPCSDGSYKDELFYFCDYKMTVKTSKDRALSFDVMELGHPCVSRQVP